MPINIAAIPDTHIRPGQDLRRIRALGRWLVKYKPDVVVFIGDWWHMASLSSYDGCVATGGAGARKRLEGKRLKADIESGCHALDVLLDPIQDHNRRSRRSGRSGLQYLPKTVFCIGNHEERLARIPEICPQLDGIIGLEDIIDALERRGIEVAGFLKPVEIAGFTFSHYFPDKRGGAIPVTTSASKIHKSAIWGHTHAVGYNISTDIDGRVINRLCVGTFFDPEECYGGEQSGFFHLTDAADGDASIHYIRTADLLARYGEGQPPRRKHLSAQDAEERADAA